MESYDLVELVHIGVYVQYHEVIMLEAEKPGGKRKRYCMVSDYICIFLGDS